MGHGTMRSTLCVMAVLTLPIGWRQVPVHAAVNTFDGPRTLNPQGFPYPDSLDEVKAAPGQYRLLYEDNHLRLIEVTYRPGEKPSEPIGGPYSSIIAYDAAQPIMKETQLDPNTTLSAAMGYGPAPKGMNYPTCATTGPQAPHQLQNVDTFPAHYYRVEFKRVDGDDFKTNWATWYPYMVRRMTVWEWLNTPGVDRPYGQAAEPEYSDNGSGNRTINPANFPYDDNYDSFRVAPGQHWLRYQDGHVRFLEVIYRAGELGDGLHGHPYSSVFARDSVAGKAEDQHLDPDSPINGQNAGRGPAPDGLKYPSCSTMGPQAPHRPHNIDTFPIHFYRLEFTRVDGDGIRTNWAQWYPWMVSEAKTGTSRSSQKTNR